MKHYLVILLLLGWACQSAPEPTRAEKIAGLYCECTAQLAQLNKQAAQAAGDTLAQTNFAGLLQQIETEYNNARDCSRAIIVQYGKLKPEELAEVEKALAKKCTDMTEQRDLLREMLGE